METEVSYDLRFIVITAGLPFDVHNLHRYFIDLFISHMIQYSSDYDPRYPRKQSWFESKLVTCIFLLFSICFYFDLFILFYL